LQDLKILLVQILELEILQKKKGKGAIPEDSAGSGSGSGLALSDDIKKDELKAASEEELEDALI